jgi:dimethylhistidine N-methyltransferase
MHRPSTGTRRLNPAATFNPARRTPATDRFLAEVLDGLRRPEKELPCKYFYDERGSWLFDRICELDEYYLTRTELAILDRSPEMAALLGPGCLLVEFGSGSGLKTRLLLDHLREPAAYVPVDLAREHLLHSAAELRALYPGLEVLPLCADFTGDLELPAPRRPATRRAVFFPGSTIGNFGPAETDRLLRRIARLCGPGGALLLGTDLRKDPALLEAAYNDREGVTAEFNLNLLRRINRELDADFDLDAFRHVAVYDRQHGCIEMHLVSRHEQTVRLADTTILFAQDETIRTEYSYKYDLEEFREQAAGAGLNVVRVWTDERRLFAVQYLTVGAGAI